MGKHYKSVFENETELLKALISIHLNGGKIQLDPMYFKGNFYKGGIEKPDYYYDSKIDLCGGIDRPKVADARNLEWFNDEKFNSIILDPPFMFEIRNRKNENYGVNTHGILKGFSKLKELYQSILKEAYRLLKKGGVLIFKCQDYTDSKTTMTHIFVHDWAVMAGFHPKDLAILVKPNKIYNSHLRQRHLRKIHTYFWVFTKK